MCNEYPPTDVRPVTEELHGIEITDPYRWLEDSDSPEVKEWIERQNACTAAFFEKIGAKEKIEQRLRSMLKYDVLGYSRFTPTVSGSRVRFFYTYREADEIQMKLCYQDGEDGKRTVIADPLELSPEGNAAIDWFYPSWDGSLIVYGMSESGSGESTLFVYDVDNSRLLDERIPRTTRCSVAWLKDNTGFYYTRNPLNEASEKKRHYNKHVFYHRLGTDYSDDPKVQGEGLDPAALPFVITNRENTHVVTIWQRFSYNDVYISEVGQSHESFDFRPIVIGDDTKNIPYLTDSHLFVLTEQDAPKGRIVCFDLDKSKSVGGLQDFDTVVADGEYVISEFLPIGDYIVVVEDVIAHSQLKIYDMHSNLHRIVEYENPVNINSLRSCPGLSKVYFKFTSFFCPSRLDFYDPCCGYGTFFRPALQIKDEKFVAQQIWYESKDGTQVPMFILHLRDTKIKPTTPVIVTGYGGFGIPFRPLFMPPYILWLEMGGVYAIANLRGGNELGQMWHHLGMRDKKQNTFDDFISAIEWLSSNGYGTFSTIGISGSSNGGLLIGATLVQRPEIIRSAYCSVPLLDMIRYPYFKIGKYWLPEYGNPKDEEEFQWLYSYSPYHNVIDGINYPAILFNTADNDSTVDSMHAMKMAARIQTATDRSIFESPVLFWLESKAGHGQGKSLEQYIETWAQELSFHGYFLGLFEE